MTSPKVVFWNSQPTPYMVDRWNAVVRRSKVDLHAWFNVVREADRSWTVDESEWEFNGSYIKPRKALGRTVYLPFEQLASNRPDMIIQEYATPSMVLGFSIARRTDARITFRGLPTFDSWVKRNKGKEILKNILFRAADGAKTAGPDGVAMFEKYGMPKNRIFEVTQSVDVPLFASSAEVSPITRVDHRNRLGITGCAFIYVGRLWQKKGLDTLICAYRRLIEEGQCISLIIVGDGVDETRYKKQTADLPNVVFTGFIQQDALPLYYALADVFVFPTLGDPNGLVVEEAMASGLPVITSSAAGDIEQRVVEGVSGYIFEPEDIDQLATKMRLLTCNSELRMHMSVAGRSIASLKNHEKYADDFEKFVFSVLAQEPRRNGFSIGAKALGYGLNACWKASERENVTGPLPSATHKAASTKSRKEKLDE